MVDLVINHIVRDAAVRQGKPYIKGKGVTVQNIVEDTRTGMTAEQIAAQFDLTLGQIYAALSYYYDHQTEINEAIEADQKFRDTLMQSDEYRIAQTKIERIKARMAEIKTQQAKDQNHES